MDDIQKLFTELFTKDQQTALIIITIGVMVATQAFKKIYFGLYPVRNAVKREAILWLAAVSFGAIGGLLGYFVAIPPQPLWFWLFTGVASGGAAIGMFKVLIDVIWPKFSGIKAKKPIVVTKDQILKMPKDEADDPTRFYIKDDKE